MFVFVSNSSHGFQPTTRHWKTDFKTLPSWPYLHVHECRCWYLNKDTKIQQQVNHHFISDNVVEASPGLHLEPTDQFIWTMTYNAMNILIWNMLSALMITPISKWEQVSIRKSMLWSLLQPNQTLMRIDQHWTSSYCSETNSQPYLNHIIHHLRLCTWTKFRQIGQTENTLQY